MGLALRGRFVRRVQCPDGHWFDVTVDEACPHGPAEDPCGWRPPEEKPPEPRKRAVEGQLLEVDRDAWQLMTDEAQQRGLEGIAAARDALAEAEFRRGLPAGTRALLEAPPLDVEEERIR